MHVLPQPAKIIQKITKILLAYSIEECPSQILVECGCHLSASVLPAPELVSACNSNVRTRGWVHSEMAAVEQLEQFW
jgi:hypothetical protein